MTVQIWLVYNNIMSFRYLFTSETVNSLSRREKSKDSVGDIVRLSY